MHRKMHILDVTVAFLGPQNASESLVAGLQEGLLLRAGEGAKMNLRCFCV